MEMRMADRRRALSSCRPAKDYSGKMNITLCEINIKDKT